MAGLWSSPVGTPCFPAIPWRQKMLDNKPRAPISQPVSGILLCRNLPLNGFCYCCCFLCCVFFLTEQSFFKKNSNPYQIPFLPSPHPPPSCFRQHCVCDGVCVSQMHGNPQVESGQEFLHQVFGVFFFLIYWT